MAFYGEAGGVQFGLAPSDGELSIQERCDCGIKCLADQAERRQLLAAVNLKGVSIMAQERGDGGHTCSAIHRSSSGRPANTIDDVAILSLASSGFGVCGLQNI